MLRSNFLVSTRGKPKFEREGRVYTVDHVDGVGVEGGQSVVYMKCDKCSKRIIGKTTEYYSRREYFDR
jgi:hypothetical protein